jgi:hypothetical protein
MACDHCEMKGNVIDELRDEVEQLTRSYAILMDVKNTIEGQRDRFKTALNQIADVGDLPLTASAVVARRALHNWNVP